MKKYITLSLVFFFLGMMSAFLMQESIKPKNNASSKIESKTISGSPLTIEKISYKDKSTIINTKYLSKGESDIVIPNKSNPSANAWDSYHWGVGGMMSTNLTYHFLTSYRYERFMGIGDVWCKNKNGYEFGLSFGAIYILSL